MKPETKHRSRTSFSVQSLEGVKTKFIISAPFLKAILFWLNTVIINSRDYTSCESKQMFKLKMNLFRGSNDWFSSEAVIKHYNYKWNLRFWSERKPEKQRKLKNSMREEYVWEN